jgi:hypothetical protein
VVTDEDDGLRGEALLGASRRALLRGAGATLVSAAGLALTGCGRQGKVGQKAVKHAQHPVQQADLVLLRGLLGLERWTIAAYTAGIPLLARPDARTAKQLLDEELQHAGELLSLIKAAGGGKGPLRASSYRLGSPTNDRQVLELLHVLERAQINAYLDAIPKLSPGQVRAAVSSILASDAQHIAFIRAGLGLVPAPSPFVTGHE